MGLLRRILGLEAAETLTGKAVGLKAAPGDEWRMQDWPAGMRVVDPGLPLNYYAGGVDVEAMWRTQPNVRKVTDFIARNVASIPLHVYERVSDVDRQRITDGPLAQTIAEPSAYTAPYRFWHRVLLDGLLYDRWALLKVPREDSDAMRLVRVPPWRVRFTYDGLDQVTAVEVATDDGWTEYPTEQVVFDFGYAPRGAGGVSPLETLRDVLDESAEAVSYRRQVWRNGARVPAWIERPLDAPEWDRTDRERFRSQFRASYTADGPEAGGVPLMEDGMTLHESRAFSPQDTQDLEGRRLTAIEVAAAYHIAPELVGAQQGNYSNVREYRQMLYRDSLGGYVSAWEGALHAQLTPELAGGRVFYVEANIEAKLRGSFEEQAQILSSAVGAPYMLRAEARARMNLPAIDEADGLVVPLNVLVGGQASPVDTGSQNTAPKAYAGRVRVKAADPLSEAERDAYAGEIATYAHRQASAIMSALGAKAVPPLADVWDGARWDRELTAVLLRRMRRAAQAGADEVTNTTGGDFDPDVMLGWLTAAAKNTAHGWNTKTYDELADAVKDPEWKDTVRHVFDVAAGGRALYLAYTTATDAGNFGRHDAASKTGLAVKTWVVTSSNPRSSHAALDGETVALGEVFSNGARWPGDSVLPEDERANCRCEIEFGREET